MKFYRRDDHGVRYYESESNPSPRIARFEIETPRYGYGWTVRVMRREITTEDFRADNRLQDFKTLREAKAACEAHAASDRFLPVVKA